MDNELKEALAIIKKVCASFSGTLAEHQTIQSALGVIEEKVAKPKKK